MTEPGHSTTKPWQKAEWKKCRLELLAKYPRCWWCGSDFSPPKNPGVCHHWIGYPNRNYERINDWWIVVLCKRCHFLHSQYGVYVCPQCGSEEGRFTLRPKMLCEGCKDRNPISRTHLKMLEKRAEVHLGWLNDLKVNKNLDRKEWEERVKRADMLARKYLGEAQSLRSLLACQAEKRREEEKTERVIQAEKRREEEKAEAITEKEEAIEQLAYWARQAGLNMKEFIQSHETLVISAEVRCWKCGVPIIVYDWFPHGEPWKGTPPPGELPTVKYRGTSVVHEDHYVNTCQCCGANQGWFFLIHEPPFVFQDCELCHIIFAALGLPFKPPEERE